jgi:precorrin-4 methylase
MILVGQALARNIPVSRLYHAEFSHEFRKAAKP